MHVMLIEDDRETAEFIRRSLTEFNWKVEWCALPKDGLRILPHTRFLRSRAAGAKYLDRFTRQTLALMSFQERLRNAATAKC